ncbi:MAG: primosomal protein N', partial [Candidatus Eremiobacteraeota bacterium]|nr:primosomal protein N' [Candidatus Eremiobacteraeota bacterium]
AWLRDFYVTTWQLSLQAVIPAPVMSRLRAESTRQRKGRALKKAAVDGVELGAYARPELTPVQHEALEAIRSARRDQKPVLLFGVTGSGKTEVYLRAVAEVLDEGGQAMVLVPEVALTPQAMERYRGRLGETVAVLHSGLSPVQRRTEWWKLRRGEARVALGTRSAVFAPLDGLSLIVIDEEHEHSYKQSEEPRYHARQVAAFRASRAGASIVLGSATPSLESFYLAQKGYYRLVEMPERATGGELPEVVRVDMRRHGRNKLLSYPLVKAISERLALKQQTVLLLNRRGFSAYLQCYECAHVCQCPDCSISLTFHRAQGRLVCHYCGYQSPPPTVCPSCSGTNFSYQGAGTERLEEELAKSLPGIRIARMDRDTTSRPGAHGEILERFAQGEADVLLGTQMVAKGLDFPGVTLVGVVNADGGLHLPDFRASERTFQLITQVAGRAGRGQWGGEVFVQAMDPDHPCLAAAAKHDFRAFYEQELLVREHSLYPPFCRLVRVGVSGLDEDATARAAHRVADELSPAIEQAQLLGPAPCPVQRIRGRYRWHLLLKGSRVQDMARTARNTLDALAHSMSDFRFLVDPDPQSLM